MEDRDMKHDVMFIYWAVHVKTLAALYVNTFHIHIHMYLYIYIYITRQGFYETPISPYQDHRQKSSIFAKDETPERGNPGGPVAIAFVLGASDTAVNILSMYNFEFT